MIRCADSCSAAALGRVRAGFRSAAVATVFNAIAAMRLVRVTAIGRMTLTSVKAGPPYTDRTTGTGFIRTPCHATALRLHEADVRILPQARKRAPATRIVCAAC